MNLCRECDAYYLRQSSDEPGFVRPTGRILALSSSRHPAVFLLVLIVGKGPAERVFHAENHVDIALVQGRQTGVGVSRIGLVPFHGGEISPDEVGMERPPAAGIDQV